MQADPGTFFVSDSGAGRPAIVFVHGFGADHRVWDAAAASLLPAMRVLACDLPGHGLSLGAEGEGSAKSAARALLADLSRRGIDKAHVVGHSMGGAVAALMALAEPRRVASLTLLAPGGFGPEINGPLLRRYAGATGRHELRACLEAMSGEGVVVSDDQLDAGLAMRTRPGQIEKLMEIAAAITRGERQGIIPAEALAALAMPATVLWGTADPVLPFTQSDGVPAHFRQQAIDGAGHMLVSEAPGAVRQAIMANLTAA